MNDDNCVFCKIINGKIPSKQVDLFSGETPFPASAGHYTAFHDINPIAPVHVVVIPNEHHAQHDLYIGYVMHIAAFIAKSILKLSSYRLVTNFGPDAGQQVEHLHVHILGGSKLGEIG